jgi:hypothetical protein
MQKATFTRIFAPVGCLVLLLFLTGLATTVSAQLPAVVKESFNYVEGDMSGMGDASGGWDDPWEDVSPGYIMVIDGELDFATIPTSGKFIEVSEGGTTFRNLADTWPDDGSSYWISQLYQRIDDIDVDDSYNGLSLFNSGSELLYIGKPWATKLLGLDGSGVGVDTTEVDAYDGGWMVVKLMMSGDAENDDAYLWIDPDPGVEPDTASAEAHVKWRGSTGFNRVRIGSGNVPNQAECFYGEIRLSQTYAGLTAGGGGDYLLPEFPPTLQAGPFPFGTEPLRDDAPVDENDPNEVIHEYTAYKGTVVVDGDLSDDAWTAIPWTLMEFYYDVTNSTDGSLWNEDLETPGWDGWEDFTAWFKMIHDDEFIYVAVMKYDDDYSFDPATYENNGNIWQNDAYQIELDARYPFDFEDELPRSEIGFCLVDEEEAYNFWGGMTTSTAQLELADGDCGSAIPSTTDKAIHGSISDSEYGIMEVMEVAFVKWDDIVDDNPGMFSICALDRDYDIRESVTQWAQGIYSPKDQLQYGSVMWSSEPVPVTAVERKADSRPTEFLLGQNYPNPFNPTTRIVYTLPASEDVTLTVYNVLGEEVARLVDREVQGAGSYSYTFDARDMASGVYLYQLRTGSRVETKKMMLLR